MRFGKWIIPAIIGVAGAIIVTLDVYCTDAAFRGLGLAFLATVGAVGAFIWQHLLERHREKQQKLRVLATKSRVHNRVSTTLTAALRDYATDKGTKDIQDMAEIEIELMSKIADPNNPPPVTLLRQLEYMLAYVEDFITHGLAGVLASETPEKRPLLYSELLSETREQRSRIGKLETGKDELERQLFEAAAELKKLPTLTEGLATASAALAETRKSLQSTETKIAKVADRAAKSPEPPAASPPQEPEKPPTSSHNDPLRCKWCGRHSKAKKNSCGELKPLGRDLILSPTESIPNPDLCARCTKLALAGNTDTPTPEPKETPVPT